jgi:hypothetical protein
VNREQVTELICQSLETDLGGIKVYEMALCCALNEQLREEWQEYLEQTQKHAQKAVLGS